MEKVLFFGEAVIATDVTYFVSSFRHVEETAMIVVEMETAALHDSWEMVTLVLMKPADQSAFPRLLLLL